MGVLSDVTDYLLIADKGTGDAGVFNMSLDRVLIVFRVIDTGDTTLRIVGGTSTDVRFR